ncbi:glycosyltransferase [Bizionia psychrotolerans]|uniref:glycosyltransferase n=1 Tax=Bizionia psychrotolerans TaxID=1492901 RepID=UPI0006510C5D|nr:glycosyltransferase [Bizionia psychrotolerans]
MNCYCTIITSNYFVYTKAIFDSLEAFNAHLDFNVLVVDDCYELQNYKNIKVLSLDSIKTTYPKDYKLIELYENDPTSNLRWALKPLFLKYLLLEKKYDKVLFLDPDLYFYQNPSFLFEQLDEADVIITPHWRSKDPLKDAVNFNSLFTGGLFNAGFFGCNASAINVLDWWLSVCAYKMEKADGFYVDQAYLNLMSIYFSEQVQVLQHRGCNVSNWNLIECERIERGNEILINNKYPIVFIHFTNATINFIANGKDKLLKPFLEQYKDNLLKHNKKFIFNYEMHDIDDKKNFSAVIKKNI